VFGTVPPVHWSTSPYDFSPTTQYLLPAARPECLKYMSPIAIFGCVLYEAIWYTAMLTVVQSTVPYMMSGSHVEVPQGTIPHMVMLNVK
jgi:hypothetical protein